MNHPLHESTLTTSSHPLLDRQRDSLTHQEEFQKADLGSLEEINFQESHAMIIGSELCSGKDNYHAASGITDVRAVG